jgi:photosystem II stability/assembly factor-like uncharacterized protein
MQFINKHILAIALILLILIVSIYVLGCFPDRYPVTPEQYETRRPKIGYVIPSDGDSVTNNASLLIQVWFDELMNHQSVEQKFAMTLVSHEETWTQITSVKSLTQSKTEPNLLYLSRQNKGAFFSTDLGNSWRFLETLAEMRVNELNIDPTNSSIIYALTDSMLLKSINGAQSWASIHNNLPSSLLIFCLDFDPINNNKLWIGTSAGVFFSDDAGSTWNQTGSLPQWTGQTIVKIEVDPRDPSIVYVATLGRYLYKSSDSGVAWALKSGTTNRLGASRIYDVAIDPDNSLILYATTINRGIYKSIDAGENWLAVNNGIADLNARKIRFHPQNGSILYLATVNRLYRSDDKAASWSEISIPVDINIQEFFGGYDDISSLYLAAANNVYMSNDDGNSWMAKNTIDGESIIVPGLYEFSSWQDPLQFIGIDEEGRTDTTWISPYRYNDALAAYDAGLISDPPVDPNPKATKVTFTPNAKIFSGWEYQILIKGAFQEGVLQEEFGARDINGMSLENDLISYFYIK